MPQYNNSIGNVAKILSLFTSANPKWGISDIARELGVSKTTSYNLISSLEKIGFLFHDEESKKYFLKTNVGDITNIEVENIPHEKMTSVQEGSPMQKIGYVFEPKGDKTLVTLWAEFELDDQKEVMEMAGDLFLKSLKVYIEYLSSGGNPADYKKSFSKIKKA